MFGVYVVREVKVSADDGQSMLEGSRTVLLTVSSLAVEPQYSEKM